jgi:hypothetical protein
LVLKVLRRTHYAKLQTFTKYDLTSGYFTFYNVYMQEKAVDLGGRRKQPRTSLSMTLREPAAASGVFSSQLGRIERGKHFQSRRIDNPLGFNEDEPFTLVTSIM